MSELSNNYCRVDTQVSVFHDNVKSPVGGYPLLYAPICFTARKLPYEKTNIPPFHAALPSDEGLQTMPEVDFSFEFPYRDGLDMFLHPAHVFYDDELYGQGKLRAVSGLDLTADWVQLEGYQSPALESMRLPNLPHLRLGFEDDRQCWGLDELTIARDSLTRLIQDAQRAFSQ